MHMPEDAKFQFICLPEKLFELFSLCLKLLQYFINSNFYLKHHINT